MLWIYLSLSSRLLRCSHWLRVVSVLHCMQEPSLNDKVITKRLEQKSDSGGGIKIKFCGKGFSSCSRLRLCALNKRNVDLALYLHNDCLLMAANDLHANRVLIAGSRGWAPKSADHHFGSLAMFYVFVLARFKLSESWSIYSGRCYQLAKHRMRWKSSRFRALWVPSAWPQIR